MEDILRIRKNYEDSRVDCIDYALALIFKGEIENTDWLGMNEAAGVYCFMTTRNIKKLKLVNPAYTEMYIKLSKKNPGMVKVRFDGEKADVEYANFIAAVNKCKVNFDKKSVTLPIYYIGYFIYEHCYEYDEIDL
jgi:hypothetical protein